MSVKVGNWLICTQSACLLGELWVPNCPSTRFVPEKAGTEDSEIFHEFSKQNSLRKSWKISEPSVNGHKQRLESPNSSQASCAPGKTRCESKQNKKLVAGEFAIPAIPEFGSNNHYYLKGLKYQSVLCFPCLQIELLPRTPSPKYAPFVPCLRRDVEGGGGVAMAVAVCSFLSFA